MVELIALHLQLTIAQLLGVELSADATATLVCRLCCLPGLGQLLLSGCWKEGRKDLLSSVCIHKGSTRLRDWKAQLQESAPAQRLSCGLVARVA